MERSIISLAKVSGMEPYEMNQLLINQGFLTEGLTGYRLTKRGLQYAKVVQMHTDIPSQFWASQKFDDSILEALDLTTSPVNGIKSNLPPLSYNGNGGSIYELVMKIENQKTHKKKNTKNIYAVSAGIIIIASVLAISRTILKRRR